LVIGSVWPT